MSPFIKIASYLFHPIWMPLAGTVYYFILTPRYIPAPYIKAKILAISIITVFLPVVLLFFMKTIGLISSIKLPITKERKLPLLLFLILTILAMRIIVTPENYMELYLFFGGIFLSGVIAFIGVLLKMKISLHTIGISGIATFIAALSIHFAINLNATLAFLVFCIGWTASARLQAKAHTLTEISLGLLSGVIPQLVLWSLWLK
ncbi:hypothetical protein GCM10009117_06640 [Gangjinia marincola]|uniref:Transmembrane protein n=1 Tax=Gangjinia marincola TaxID=578463 RepID=A0ABN1MEH0_9FLAO